VVDSKYCHPVTQSVPPLLEKGGVAEKKVEPRPINVNPDTKKMIR